MEQEPGNSSPSKASLLGLDGLNFLMADVRDGVGPFLSVYLKGGQHWQAGQIGVAMAASSIAAALCQVPAGLLVDSIQSKPSHGEKEKAEPLPISELLKKRTLLIFLASVILFHFGNAAMLPMAGQVLAKTHPGVDISALSACIIAAQLVMVGVAAAVGWALRRRIGRKPIFLVALVTLPIRGILFTFTDTPSVSSPSSCSTGWQPEFSESYPW